MMTKRQKAARKAARTRAANQSMLKHWREVGEPTNRRVETLINILLKTSPPISVSWAPLGGVSRKLMHGAQYGRLIAVRAGGKVWRVEIEGYKRAQDFHAGFWTVLHP